MKNTKIGLIQNSTLTADLSNNLRAIVQGYRECVDQGAELIIASAYALCGLEPLDLVKRDSFLEQTERALDTLSRELSGPPLILGAYAKVDADALGLDEEELAHEVQEAQLTPFLLEPCSVSMLDECTLEEIAGLNTYIEISDEETIPDCDNIDLLIHLSPAPWSSDSAAKQLDTLRWEATELNCAVARVAGLGTAGGQVYGGGSALASNQGQIALLLPHFESSNGTVPINSPLHANALPEERELLLQALLRGIRDYTRANAYRGVCLPTNQPHAELLALLCIEALGSKQVKLISLAQSPEFAQSLQLDCRCIEPIAMQDTAGFKETTQPALRARLEYALYTSVAEEEGYMLLSSLSRRDILLGNFTLYGESCAALLPFGDLYEQDIYELAQYLYEQRNNSPLNTPTPSRPELDRIIHELDDLNQSPANLIAEKGVLFAENDVRYVQRRLMASAIKREQLPPRLMVSPPSQQHRFPVCHRLND